jgi:hypothetical protein
MAGNPTDTTIVTVTMRLPDGGVVTVTGEDDGVNGFEWTASFKPARDPRAVRLDCDVQTKVLVDGIYDQDEDHGET